MSAVSIIAPWRPGDTLLRQIRQTARRNAATIKPASRFGPWWRLPIRFASHLMSDGPHLASSGGHLISSTSAPNCCFKQSRKCSDGTLSGLYLSTANIAALGAGATLVQGGICYYFDPADKSKPFCHGTLHAGYSAVANCSDAACGTPCSCTPTFPSSITSYQCDSYSSSFDIGSSAGGTYPCTITVTSNASWIHITNGPTYTLTGPADHATVNYDIDLWTTDCSLRTGTITICSQTLTYNQFPSCTGGPTEPDVSGNPQRCRSLCAGTYTATVTGDPDINGTYTLSIESSNCFWSSHPFGATVFADLDCFGRNIFCPYNLTIQNNATGAVHRWTIPALGTCCPVLGTYLDRTTGTCTVVLS